MPPPVFKKLSFEDALAKTKNGKLLIVDATASWCQPCKHMDKTTWVHPGVVDMIGRLGLAIQFDVDEQKELAKKLAVRAMPTVIAFRDGVEMDRIMGLRAPAAFAAWLDALARGETSVDVARKAAREDPANVDARLGLARTLLQSGGLDEATTEHVWLWQHMLEHAPQMIGVRHSFVMQQIMELAARHPPARDAFARIRDQAPPGTLDWYSLNRALKDEAKTLEWFDTVKHKLKDDAALAKSVEAGVIPLLIAAGRWAEAGKAYVSPIKTIERIIEHAKRAETLATQLPPDQAAEARLEFRKINTTEVSRLRRALHEAGRDEELRAVERAASTFDAAWIVTSAK
jgi:thiol-disulfide isomerase/thioredoxin